MSGDRVRITTGGGPREGCRGTQLSDRVEAATGQLLVGLDRDSYLGSQPLDLAQEGHDMVGGHTCGRVVEGPMLVGDGEEPSSEVINHGGRQLVSRDCEPAARQQTSGADIGARQRNERMDRCPTTMWPQNVEAKRPGRVSNDRQPRLDGIGNGTDGTIGSGYENQVDMLGCARDGLLSTRQGHDIPSDLAESSSEAATGATGTNNVHSPSHR